MNNNRLAKSLATLHRVIGELLEGAVSMNSSDAEQAIALLAREAEIRLEEWLYDLECEEARRDQYGKEQ